MSTDRYTSPLSERYASRGDAVHFLTGYEIPHLEKTVDCTGRDRERTGTCHITQEQIDEIESPCR